MIFRSRSSTGGQPMAWSADRSAFTRLSRHERLTVSNIETQVFTTNTFFITCPLMPGLGTEPRSTACEACVLTNILPRLSSQTRCDSQRLRSGLCQISLPSLQKSTKGSSNTSNSNHIQHGTLGACFCF